MKPRSLSLTALAIALIHLLPSTAAADIGVEKVSRLNGAPGQEVRVIVGCGACTHPSRTPASFPISLVRVDKVPKPHRCGPRALCSPRVRAVPKHAPFTYLGDALLAQDERDSGPIRRYVLEYEIPQLPTGSYTYVIFCDACADGEGGTLIANPNPKPRFWRLGISPVARGTP